MLLISDIRALWRSGVSARVPEYKRETEKTALATKTSYSQVWYTFKISSQKIFFWKLQHEHTDRQT